MSQKDAKELLKGKTYSQVKKALGADPLSMISKLKVVVGGTSITSIRKPKDIVVIFSGSFDASAILKKLTTIPLPPGTPKLVITREGGKEVVRAGRKGDGIAMVVMGPHTLTFGAISMLDIILKGDLSGGNPPIARQLKSLPSGLLAWLAFGAFEMPGGSLGTSPMLAAISKIKGGVVLIQRTQKSWTVTNRLDLDTPEAAQALLKFVNMMKLALRSTRGKKGGPPPLVASLLEKTSAKATGKLVVARLTVTEARVKKLLDLLLNKL